jgi:hypothetical protein
VGDWRLVAEGKPAAAGRAGRDPLMVGNNGLGTPVAGGRRRRVAAEGVIPVSSDRVAVRVAESPVKGKFLPVAAEPGKAVRVVCELESPRTGDFTAKLDGLPPRATAEPVAVPAGTRRVEFTVRVEATTPPGEHPSLVCELAGEVGGQKVVYRVGRGGVLTVNTPGGVKTDASGKPLSPLDALRQSEKKDAPKKP